MRARSRRVVAIVIAVTVVATGLVPVAPASAGSEDADVDAAVNWAWGAGWQSNGLATRFPDHVAFPSDSGPILDTLQRRGADDRVDGAAAAAAASRVQIDGSGVLHMQGDFLGPWASDTHQAVRLHDRHGTPLDEDGAATFLSALQNDDGGFAPRGSLFGGNLPSFMASTYHATAGLDRLGELDEGQRADAVAFLVEHQNEDGGWPTSMYNPDQSSVTGTYWAVRALASLDALNATIAEQARAYLRSLQKPDGGFLHSHDVIPCSVSYPFIVCSDHVEATTYSTSRAILALDVVASHLGSGAILNATARDRHGDWLSDRQIVDGFFSGAFLTYGDHPTAIPGDGIVPAEAILRTNAPDSPYRVSIIEFTETTRLGLDALAALGQPDRADTDAALDYLVSTQHPGTGGFGWWPGYLAELPSTNHQLAVLEATGRIDAAPADAVAETMAANQRSDGAIVPPHWDWDPRLVDTAHALLALERVGRLDAVDVGAAAGFLADHQKDSGGFGGFDASIRETALVVDTLATVGELDRIDRPAAAGYLADQQADDGRISSARPEHTFSAIDTGRALEALALLGGLDRVDVDAAAGFLADRQQADGGFLSTNAARNVVVGLATVDELDRIDVDAARSALADRQRKRGEFASSGFYLSSDDGWHSAMARQRSAVEALDVLGGLGSGPCQASADGSGPRNLDLELDRSRVVADQGESVRVAGRLADPGYGRADVGLSSQGAPDGVAVDVAPSSASLAPLDGASIDVEVTVELDAPDGAHTVTVCAAEPGGGSAATTLKVVVPSADGDNLAPAIDAPDTATGTAGATLAVDVAADDPDGPAPLQLDAEADPAVDGATFLDHGDGTGTWAWSIPDDRIAGTTLTVHAYDGADTTSATVDVDVLNEPSADLEPPAIRDRSEATRVVAGQSLRFQGSSVDLDGTIVDAAFLVDGPHETQLPAAGGTSPLYAFPEPGTYQVTYRVRDDDGIVATAGATFDVFANAPPDARPKSASVLVDDPDPVVPLDGSPTVEPDDQPVRYRWTTSTGEIVAYPSAIWSVVPLSWEPPAAGTYSATLNVTDVMGAGDEATIDVAVDDAIGVDAGPLPGSGRIATREQAIVAATVHDETGAAVSGATVTFNVSHVPSGQPIRSVRATTDDAGRVEVTLPHDVDAGGDGANLPGEHRVEVTARTDNRVHLADDPGPHETATTTLTYRVSPFA